MSSVRAGVEAGRRDLTTFTFSGLQDAPVAALSGSIKLNVAAKAGKAEVTVAAGAAKAATQVSAAALRKLSGSKISLAEVARISVLHSSIQNYLLSLSNERYQLLSQWPDFTTMYGKDFYYRAHPEDLKKFYDAADEYYKLYETVTEFDSLSALASQVVPNYAARRRSTVHPAIGSTVADGAFTNFLLSKQ
uniref:Mitochondrial ATP synthase associated protein ASA7 n=1 Tax=Polytomella sp. Pringsheim 198.80 TaxID=37502 RepID=D8V7I2_9CHLO|nr:Chain 7, Mitochondrial ATP synthase associated protein ASA7 [Polytomella sp. Pringsheim 198.80]6RD6_7 Chain 7, Mitochondrial ATP synthase associated protein ASA7 [Polytomella sp. Pringsheim 198.80]6RD9_7 Chain 7, Mitochondrial ATP synthase associated protein ASA7 [Polytomella sp. Pringsheim 198.80]6RDA_7 Chain 7, Mitochondrial ATP synthase associated protein ASA7 [Polytomella sp. Pringsheim 198.80]6RDC_7 Chain 7, Mitochondrial ATP synthase associated protein ASA7 [Polytomella sp. Pringsheim 